MKFRLILILLISSVLISCSSVGIRLYSEPLCEKGHKYCRDEPYMSYLAIAQDINIISLCYIEHCYLGGYDFFIYVPMSIVDIPFSFVLDTLFLPVDTYLIISD